VGDNQPHSPEGVSLKEYFESRLAATVKYFEDRLNYTQGHIEDKMVGHEKALTVARNELEKQTQAAREDMDKRLDGMNEFRSTLKDQSAGFATRAEHTALEKQVRALELVGAELRGKASQTSVNIAYVLTVVAIVISIIGFFVRR
jgi:hypothetical protein